MVQASTQFQPVVQAFEAWQALHSVPQAPPELSAEVMHESQVPPDPVVLPVDDPVLLPVDDPVLLPVDDPVLLPVDDPVLLPVDDPVVEPVEPVVPPPQSLAHSLVQAVLQMQSPIAWNSLAAVLPAVVAQLSWQVVSVSAQLPRQVLRAAQAVSLRQVLVCVAQAPVVLVASVWQVSQLVAAPVVPPVEPVVPPVEPVVPPPHSVVHSVEQAVQPQVPMAFRRSWLAWGAAEVQPLSQVESPEAQLLRQVLSVVQALSAPQAATCESQEPPEA